MVEKIVVLGPTIIAALVAYVAWQQWRTARDKLKLELFEKRFAVWISLQGLLAQVVSEGTVDMNSSLRFRHETANARFLFDDDVVDHLKTIFEKALDLNSRTIDRRETDGKQDPERKQLVAAEHESLSWFIEEALPASVKVFEKYLRFKKP